MQSVTRRVALSARNLRSQQRRWASDAGHGHATGPRNESFGPIFFISLLGIPASLALYHISQPGKNGEQPYFSRLITSFYAQNAKEDEERNALHTDAIEQAAADRTLFLNENSLNKTHIHVKFPEQLNGGNPYNVPAGGYANMEALIQKYQKESYEQEAKKLQQIKDNNVPSEKPFVSKFTKATPAAADS